MRVYRVGAFSFGDKIADQAIDFRRPRAFRDTRANDGGFRFRAWRIVAFVADPDNFAVEAKVKEDFGGRWDERDDTHTGTLPQKFGHKEHRRPSPNGRSCPGITYR